MTSLTVLGAGGANKLLLTAIAPLPPMIAATNEQTINRTRIAKTPRYKVDKQGKLSHKSLSVFAGELQAILAKSTK
jgi:hypothetical protein